MSYASIKYVSASGTTFALTNNNGDPIEYLRQDDISVYVNNVLKTVGTDYTFNSAGTAIVLNTPVTGAEVYISRTTDISESVVEFTPGSTLTSNDLNNSNDQYRFALQEFRDTYAALTQGTDDLGEFPGIIDNTETWISDDSHWPTTAALDTRFVDQINNETIGGVKTFSSSPVVPTPSTGTQAVNKAYVDDNYWNVDGETINTSEQNAGTPTWDDTKIPTAGAAARRFDTLVQTATPSGSVWEVGKTWFQNDANKTLSIWNGSGWIGVASGGTFTTQPTVIYVDSANGNDADDGRRIINPKKTIKAAVAAANAGDIIKVAPGVYQEALPIDITVDNLSIVGDSQRSCFIHPTPATETQIMFRCNSGTYIDGFTFAGLKASGTRGGHPIDNDATYGLPTTQGWVAGFLPNCIIKKSPYINNCTNFADSGIDNSTFNPNNYQGTGGDLTSAPTGGGIIVDGSVPSVSSPLRSFVVNEFTQVCLDGPGLLVCNNGYAQAVSFFGLFCHYHAKALSGGQINMEVGTTDFGRYGLIADGKSTTPIFTATANGAASAGAITFAINAPTAGANWFGDANRPAINMLAEVTVSGTTYIYPILSSSANGSGWNVTISRPNPSQRNQNLGLSVGHASGVTWRFYLRSMISTASHTMEYAGSGTNYNALPENGGVPIEANEAINRNDGKVWLTSTDQSGKFKVGDTFVVDQQTGFVNVDPTSYGVNIVSDLTPELGGDLDVLGRRIYTSNTNGNIDLDANGSGLFRVTEYNLSRVPVVTQHDIGSAPDQLSLNYMLGDLAFQNAASVSLGTASVDLGTVGQVGVGTSTPQGIVHIATTSTRAILLNNSTIGTTNTDGTYLTNNTDGSFGIINQENSHMRFGTNNTEALRIDSNGRVLAGLTSANTNGGILQLSSGITFPAAQVASADPNTLDDYEEGTWTPVLRGSGTAGTYELSRAIGIYTKVGRQVTLTMSIQLAGTITGGGTGYAQITGLPFQQAANSFPTNACRTIGVDISTNYTSVFFQPIAAASTSTWFLSEVGDNVGSNDLPIAAFSTGDIVEVTVNYIV